MTNLKHIIKKNRQVFFFGGTLQSLTIVVVKGYARTNLANSFFSTTIEPDPELRRAAILFRFVLRFVRLIRDSFRVPVRPEPVRSLFLRHTGR